MSATATTPARSYDGVQKAFHWTIAALLVLQFATKLIPPGSMTEDQLDQWHVAIGPTILLLTLLRLAWRLTHQVPPPPTDLSAPLALLSRVTHWGFYVVLIVMPICGWISLSYFGGHPTILGLIPLPALTGADKSLAEQWGAIHGAFGWILLALIALHLAGVSYHAGVRQDGVLARIMPGSQ